MLPEDFGWEEPPPRELVTVYRYFREEAHAEALRQGTVWISTLGACRRYENAEQGDAGEGHFQYSSGSVSGLGGDPQVARALERMNMSASPHARVTLRDNIALGILVDAYVLCLTTRFDPERMAADFGSYCIELQRPARVFELITRQMQHTGRLHQWQFRPIHYRPREFAGLEDSPQGPGFVKPNRFSWQCEARMMWTVFGHEPIQPFALQVPGVSRLCRRLA